MTRRWLVLAAMAALSSGCGESGPALVPVKGVVTHNGKPLEGAVVSFLPDPSNKEGLPGEDITGPEGNYTATTKGRFGLVPGKYHVQVTKSLIDPAKVSEAFKDDPFMAQLSDAGPEVGPGGGPRKKKAQDDKIEGVFDREVSLEQGVQDFDVKTDSSVK